MKKILLVEPAYRNKYPPLALMKISTYHKRMGDEVFFCRGKKSELKKCCWDRIYISTLFTFHWKIVIETIKYYKKSVVKTSDIICGGVLATVLGEELKEETGVTVISGLLDEPGILDNNDIIIDTLPPDYSIIDTSENEFLSYEYPVKDSYIAYATRGCVRRCKFCAVPSIEPCFGPYIDIKEQVNYIKDNYGEKKHLLLLDNNVLASDRFDDIIDDIKQLGYAKGATYKRILGNGRTSTSKKYVDFNQGIDARLLTREKCMKLAEIAIRPLRIAFDSADEKSVSLYKEKAAMAAECGIEHLSNYILFNYEDTPEELYMRLEINLELNEYFESVGNKARIWSFPMKYSPIKGEHCFDRKYIGEHWNKKYLRGVHCILNATHGMVGPKKAYFHIAFGESVEEFMEILSMPERYVIERKKSADKGLTAEWRKIFSELSADSCEYDYIMNGNLREIPLEFKQSLRHYIM